MLRARARILTRVARACSACPQERLLESSLETAAAIEAQLGQQKSQNEHLLAELAEHELRANSSFGEGAAAASAASTELSDRLAERLNELVREFQRKTLQLNRADADVYMRMLQLQSWFLESLDRRLVQCREKMARVYEGTLGQRAAVGGGMMSSGGPQPPAGPAADEPPSRSSAAPTPRGNGSAGGGGGGGCGGVSSSYVGLVDGGDSDDFDD